MKIIWFALLSLLPQQTLIPVKVELITRAVSKTPVLIAYDKGLFKKYGLDVKLWLPPGEFPGAIETPGKMQNADIADDRYMALAKQEGYPVLADTSKWNQAIAGNSVRVEPNWIKDPKNRDIAIRFLKATVEGMAIYMNNREETLRVLAKYHGIK